MAETQVLITGAGPTGLVLAYWLERLGVRVRIVDKTSEPGTTSRALGVQARTLEFYQQLGLAGELIDRGLEFTAANLWVRAARKARVAFGDMGKDLSPYPYMLIYPQDEHERLLIERLNAAGVHVERRTELLSFEDKDGRVVARLRGPEGREEDCEALYLAGCDGARSTVRHALGIGFPGGTYARFFYVADVEASGPFINGELHVALDDAEFLALFIDTYGLEIANEQVDDAVAFVTPAILERVREMWLQGTPTLVAVDSGHECVNALLD
jgi:2-polyprenyl-6-methoxyphenol hydroxylase-like FAD-dependent oxidoreductase